MVVSISFENVRPQEFAFSKPIMNYVLDNVTPRHLRKLYKTCKWFYAKLQIHMVGNLIFDIEEMSNEKRRNNEEVTYIKSQEFHLLKDDLWITEGLSLQAYVNIPIFLSKIYKCDLSYLQICRGLKLTLDELKLLSSDTLKSVDLFSTFYYSDGAQVPLEELIRALPKADDLGIRPCHVTQKTMKKLLEMKRAQKIKQLILFGIGGWLDPELVDQFLQKNLINKANINFRFFDFEMNQLFFLQLTSNIQKWPAEKLPEDFPKRFMQNLFNLMPF